MNRTMQEVTVKRLHYKDHDQLPTHLVDFKAYNFARRLKTLSGLKPYEYIANLDFSDSLTLESALRPIAMDLGRPGSRSALCATLHRALVAVRPCLHSKLRACWASAVAVEQ